jgi:REP element-mobilizing transposase RayT
MPRPGMQWRHVIFSTHNSWLPGSPLGFRSRDHHIHSSGDYKNPPPAKEHAGLHRYAKKISGAPVVIDATLRERIGRAILADLKKRGCRVLALAVASNHVHFLAEMPADGEKYRDIVGRCKTAACHAVKEELPGRIWGRSATYKLIKDEQHQRNTYRYILTQKDAWVWSFTEDEKADKDAQTEGKEDSP